MTGITPNTNDAVDDFKKARETLHKEAPEFVRSYQEFLEQWHAYQAAKGSDSRVRERRGKSNFRATFRRSL